MMTRYSETKMGQFGGAVDRTGEAPTEWRRTTGCPPRTRNVRENQRQVCPFLYEELEDREHFLVLEPRRPSFRNNVTNLRNGRVALIQPHGLLFAVGDTL